MGLLGWGGLRALEGRKLLKNLKLLPEFQFRELAATVFDGLEEASGGAGGDGAIAEGGEDGIDVFLKGVVIGFRAKFAVVAAPAGGSFGRGHWAAIGCGEFGKPVWLGDSDTRLVVPAKVGVAFGEAAAGPAVGEQVVAGIECQESLHNERSPAF
jgi:hypothetical protein